MPRLHLAQSSTGNRRGASDALQRATVARPQADNGHPRRLDFAQGMQQRHLVGGARHLATGAQLGDDTRQRLIQRRRWPLQWPLIRKNTDRQGIALKLLYIPCADPNLHTATQPLLPKESRNV